MTEFRLGKDELFATLSVWGTFLSRNVHLIACGGTAMTLLNIKDSTKDIDLMVPNEEEYIHLIKTLKQIGYRRITTYGWSTGDKFIFDLYLGKRIHTTELLESPLKKGNHILIKEYKNIYLGILNHLDIIISKLFRGNTVDYEDCSALLKAKKTEINSSFPPINSVLILIICLTKSILIC